MHLPLQLSRLDGWILLQVSGIICITDLGGNCLFNILCTKAQTDEELSPVAGFTLCLRLEFFLISTSPLFFLHYLIFFFEWLHWWHHVQGCRIIVSFWVISWTDDFYIPHRSIPYGGSTVAGINLGMQVWKKSCGSCFIMQCVTIWRCYTAEASK